mmetsp:Transcript_5510/g.20814  ORF Transcript_5510/g.20814 Transcript_5510/m.20814 type:complete len:234 (+) Transcript_5510:102-803(+)
MLEVWRGIASPPPPLFAGFFHGIAHSATGRLEPGVAQRVAESRAHFGEQHLRSGRGGSSPRAIDLEAGLEHRRRICPRRGGPRRPRRRRQDATGIAGGSCRAGTRGCGRLELEGRRRLGRGRAAALWRVVLPGLRRQQRRRRRPPAGGQRTQWSGASGSAVGRCHGIADEHLDIGEAADLSKQEHLSSSYLLRHGPIAGATCAGDLAKWASHAVRAALSLGLPHPLALRRPGA